VRLGVFGGTFDPPHAGHLIAAQDAHGGLGLERVLFVPAGEPPHKPSHALSPARVRLELVRAAVAGDARFVVDDLELRRAGPSFTVDTLRALHAAEPAAELFLLLGADQYADLEHWREPAEIRRLARLAVLDREGRVPDDGAERVRVTRVDISSTDIRRRVAAGRPVRYLVPDAVEALIRRHGLYGAARPGPNAARGEG
jgi:nicotinate-nucleotide adenylyltransferase